MASATLDDLQRALVQMVVKVASTNRWKLTAVWTLDQPLGALSEHVFFELIVRDGSLTALVNACESSS
jgi:hypothetical protein